MAAGFLLPSGLFVLELAVVEEFDDGRGRCGGDLHEVVSPLLRGLEGLERGHHAKLATFFVDDPDIGDTDHLVDAQVFAQTGSLTDTFRRHGTQRSHPPRPGARPRPPG